MPAVTVADWSVLLRVIARQIVGVRGSGSTRTPISLMHASVPPGSLLALPWSPGFNALADVLAGTGAAGSGGPDLSAPVSWFASAREGV